MHKEYSHILVYIRVPKLFKKLCIGAGQGIEPEKFSTKEVTPGRPLELELSLRPSVLVTRASAMQVPSQTAGLVSTSHKT